MIDCFIVPATKVVDDEGRVLSKRRAVLHRNDGVAEESWKFDSTAEAKQEAEWLFGVTAWKRDDLGRYFSKTTEEVAEGGA